MRTILNFTIDAMGEGLPSMKEGRPAPGLFRMGEPVSGAGRWSQAVLLAVAVHAGLLAAALVLPSAHPEKAPEPELVLLTFAPPPPAPAQGAVATAVPERATRQARSRPVRPVERPMPTPKPEPVETKPEPVPEPPVEPASAEPPEEVPAAAPEQGAVGAVIGGVVGGVVGGTQGGIVGAPGGTGEAVELKQVLRAPVVLKQVNPEYPRRAREDGIQGLVVVRVIIGTDGRVEPGHTRVIRSVAALDEAAIAAVNQWRFSPAIGREGRPVRVIVKLPVEFSLK